MDTPGPRRAATRPSAGPRRYPVSMRAAETRRRVLHWAAEHSSNARVVSGTMHHVVRGHRRSSQTPLRAVSLTSVDLVHRQLADAEPPEGVGSRGCCLVSSVSLGRSSVCSVVERRGMSSALRHARPSAAATRMPSSASMSKYPARTKRVQPPFLITIGAELRKDVPSADQGDAQVVAAMPPPSEMRRSANIPATRAGIFPLLRGYRHRVRRRARW